MFAAAAAGQNPAAVAPGVILHVDAAAPAGGDGITWPTAFQFVQDPLEAARQPRSGVSEIRIAQCEYKPDQGANVTPGDIHATFWIPPGLHLAGGYAGLTQADPDARDSAIYITTFNGDLLGDDGPIGTFTNTTDNSIHISRIQSEGVKAPPARLSGIRFIRSRSYFNPDNRGGAINCELAQVVIDDCRFEGNRAEKGGAIGVIERAGHSDRVQVRSEHRFPGRRVVHPTQRCQIHVLLICAEPGRDRWRTVLLQPQ